MRPCRTSAPPARSFAGLRAFGPALGRGVAHRAHLRPQAPPRPTTMNQHEFPRSEGTYKRGSSKVAKPHLLESPRDPGTYNTYTDLAYAHCTRASTPQGWTLRGARRVARPASSPRTWLRCCCTWAWRKSTRRGQRWRPREPSRRNSCKHGSKGAAPHACRRTGGAARPFCALRPRWTTPAQPMQYGKIPYSMPAVQEPP